MTLLDSIFVYLKSHPISAAIQIITIVPYSLAYWRKKESLLVLVAVSCILFSIGYILDSAYIGAIFAISSFIVSLIARWLDRIKISKGISLITQIVFLTGCVALTGVSILLFEHFQKSTFSFESFLIILAATCEYTAFILCKENGIAFCCIILVSQGVLVLYEWLVFIPFFLVLDIVTWFIVFIRILRLINVKKSNP